MRVHSRYKTAGTIIVYASQIPLSPTRRPVLTQTGFCTSFCTSNVHCACTTTSPVPNAPTSTTCVPPHAARCSSRARCTPRTARAHAPSSSPTPTRDYSARAHSFAPSSFCSSHSPTLLFPMWLYPPRLAVAVISHLFFRAIMKRLSTNSQKKKGKEC